MGEVILSEQNPIVQKMEKELEESAKPKAAEGPKLHKFSFKAKAK